MTLRISIVFLTLSVLFACNAPKAAMTPSAIPSTATADKKGFTGIDANTIAFKNSFHGLCVYDMENKKYLYRNNDEKYFTPASTTKLLTFFAAVKLLPKKVPALYYTLRKDSLIFWGAADGSLLYDNFTDSSAIKFLRGRKEKLYFSASNFDDERFGDGWTWDDYLYDYSPEKSALPIYGNLATFKVSNEGNTIEVQPPYFTDQTKKDAAAKTPVFRKYERNDFTYRVKSGTFSVPFKTSAELSAYLLSTNVKKEIKVIDYALPADVKTLDGANLDDLLKKMLEESDNFLAEHLLLASSGRIAENNYSMSAPKVIKHLLNLDLADLPQSPNWVDGSGLSRANLFTPQDMVVLLTKIYKTFDKEKGGEKRLFNLLPTPGEGTLKSTVGMYPFTLYAKTGTLSNNHNLCGYIVTKSGKKIAFSFMNNHYTVQNSDIKKEMGKILTDLYNKY
jgi:serine-type D-Ala-D-Ala carboxypeptidase/endopeptidase (penicillin-binding protein 4)